MPNWVLILMMLIFGTFNTMNTKTQFSTCAPSRIYALAKHPKPTKSYLDGSCKKPNEDLFSHAWQTNLYMFTGEASLLIVHFTGDYFRKRRSAEPAALPMNTGSAREVLGSGLVPWYMFGIPGSCDVLGSGLAAVGQLWLDAAIWQMLRSAIIPFSAIISMVFLGRKIACFRWIGVLLVMLGLMTVGLADILDTKSSGGGANNGFFQVVGFCLTVGAQGLSAFQMVFEEKLLTGELTTTAERCVGFEGLFGIIFTSLILVLTTTTIPGNDNGHFESVQDGFYMLTHSNTLIVLAITFAMSIGVYNCVGIMVGKQLSAVVRCMADSCRTVTVWIASLILYQVTDGRMGVTFEAHTWLELVGFFILTGGTMLYNDLFPEWIVPPHWKGDARSSQDERAGSSADM